MDQKEGSFITDCGFSNIPTKLGQWQLALEPRKWQCAAIKSWADRMRGIVRVVTGGGKTAFAELCMIYFLENYPEGRVVIVVPTIALLDQWYVSLIEDLGVSENEIACYSGESHAESPSKVNIFVINTARHSAQPIPRQYDALLIVDECHRAASPINAQALAGPYKATLGLSATPEREYDLGFELTLVPKLGDIIFEYDYVQARSDGVVAPFDLVNVSAALLPDEREEYDRLSRLIARKVHSLDRNDSDGTQDYLKQLLRKRASVAANAVMRIPVALRLLEEHRGQRAIIFHERIEAAQTILRSLTERHYNAAIYHSKVDPALRRDNLRLYRRGMFDVLVTCRALDEGMNVPETTVAIIASSTASIRQRVQRLGRVLRPAIGKDRATIYTIYTTKIEEERLRREATRLSEVASVQWKRSSLSINK